MKQILSNQKIIKFKDFIFHEAYIFEMMPISKITLATDDIEIDK